MSNKHIVMIPIMSSYHLNPHPRLNRQLADWHIVPEYVDNISPIWMARREMVSRFLHGSTGEFLTMIDYDTVPKALAFRNVPEVFLEHRIVAGHYATFTPEGMFQYSVGKLVHYVPHASLYSFATSIPGDWSRWDVCGFGCVTFPRRILEPLAESGVFDEAPPIKCTEDIPVCQKIRELGHEIVTHPSLSCEHWRTVDITLQLEIQNALLTQIPEIRNLEGLS